MGGREGRPGCYSIYSLFFQVQDIGNLVGSIDVSGYDRIVITVRDPPGRVQIADRRAGIGKISNDRFGWNVHIPCAGYRKAILGADNRAIVGKLKQIA